MIPLEEITRARAALRGKVVRTPLIELRLPEDDVQIYLKLENLQPIGSFKLRGALNAIANAPPDQLRAGVVTASAGNMAQGVAWAARDLGVSCTVVVPEHAPATKLAAVERLGGHVVRVPFEDWWQTLEASAFPGADGLFVHPVENEDVMAGNGTIGLEIAEDLSQVDAIVIPFGGGGLTTGVASATRVLLPDTSVYTVEPATANPLEVSLAAGEPCEVDYEASFVDGAGGRAVLPRMWPRLLPLVDGALSVSIDRASAAVRMLAERARVVSEGAGALGLAAVLAGLPRPVESVVCIVSGGNIDPPVLASILRDGQAPS